MSYALNLFDGKGKLVKTFPAAFCHEAEMLVTSTFASPEYSGIETWVLMDPFGMCCTWRRKRGAKLPVVTEQSDRFAVIRKKVASNSPSV